MPQDISERPTRPQHATACTEQLEALRLLIEPDPRKAGSFAARLERTGEVVVGNTRQPLVDGARELLARGFDLATPLAMRMVGKAYDSFQPAPIDEWAKW